MNMSAQPVTDGISRTGRCLSDTTASRSYGQNFQGLTSSPLEVPPNQFIFPASHLKMNGMTGSSSGQTINASAEDINLEQYTQGVIASISSKASPRVKKAL